MKSRWSCIFFALIAITSQNLFAETFPSKPITLVVPFPAGGPSDALARQVAQRMGIQLGQPVIVENVGGASGTIGLTKVKQATADGYTLGFGTIGTHVANVALFKKLAYDPINDFEPIAMLGGAPLILIAKTALPANNIKEFASYLTANQQKISYGSAGVGSISHYGCVMLLSSMKQDILHVPYRGVAPAMTDLIGGQIDFMCDQTTSALQQVKAGKIKAIAALSKAEIQVLPQLGTAHAAGYAEVDVRSWNALFAPKAIPSAVIARLNKAIVLAMQEAEFRVAMEKVGVELPGADALTPAQVTATIQLGLRRDVPALKARGEYLD
jgi:tripartite-type tricarboxylate transporter receptor subunit TctC